MEDTAADQQLGSLNEFLAVEKVEKEPDPETGQLTTGDAIDWLLDEEVAGLAAGGFVDSPGLVAEGGRLPKLDLTPS